MYGENPQGFKPYTVKHTSIWEKLEEEEVILPKEEHTNSLFSTSQSWKHTYNIITYIQKFIFQILCI